MRRKRRKERRETESLLIATQNYAIRTNYIKRNIDNMQKNSKCRLCGDRDQTVNQTNIINPTNWRKRNTSVGMTVWKS